MEQNLDTDFLHHFIQCYNSKASKYQSIPILSLQQPNPILKYVVRQHCIYYGVPSISLGLDRRQLGLEREERQIIDQKK